MSLFCTAYAHAAGFSDALPNAGTAARNAELETDTSVSDVASSLIFTVLSIVGILFMILLIYSGVRWMTAGGNEDTVKTAKKNIINAVIGLIIVTAAYSIAYFIVSTVEGSAN
jgi:hypothetical protein